MNGRGVRRRRSGLVYVVPQQEPSARLRAWVEALPGLSAHARRLLLEGDTERRYGGRNEGEAGFRVTAALAVMFSQPGRAFSQTDFHAALVLRPTAGETWARGLRARKGERYLEGKLAEMLDKARAFCAASPPLTNRADAGLEIARPGGLLSGTRGGEGLPVRTRRTWSPGSGWPRRPVGSFTRSRSVSSPSSWGAPAPPWRPPTPVSRSRAGLGCSTLPGAGERALPGNFSSPKAPVTNVRRRDSSHLQGRGAGSVPETLGRRHVTAGRCTGSWLMTPSTPAPTARPQPGCCPVSRPWMEPARRTLPKQPVSTARPYVGAFVPSSTTS